MAPWTSRRDRAREPQSPRSCRGPRVSRRPSRRFSLLARRSDVHARIAWAIVGLCPRSPPSWTRCSPRPHRSLLSEATWADHGWPLAPLASVGCALMGALIVSRYPRLPLGWLLCVASLLSVTLAGDAYSLWVLEGGGSGSASLGARSRVGRATAGLASLHRVDPGVPHRPGRAPALTSLVVCRRRHPCWAWPADVGNTDLAPRRLRPQFAEIQGRPLTTGGFTTGSLLVGAGLIASAVSLGLRLRTGEG